MTFSVGRVVPVLGLLTVLEPTPARAADREKVAVASYDVPKGCPTKESLRDRIVGRTRSGATPGTTSFDVRIDARGKRRFEGRIGIHHDGNLVGERNVEAPTCDEVVSALALVAALSTNDAASSAEATPAEESAKASETQTNEKKTNETEDKQRAAPSPSVSAAASESDRNGSKAIAPSRSRMRFAAGVHGSAEVGVAPDVVFAVPGFVEVALARPPQRWLYASFAPALRLGFARASQQARFDMGDADFTWTAGRADICPMLVGIGAVALSPCGRFEIGTIEGVGKRIEPAHEVSRTWTAVGAEARLRFAPTRLLFVEVEGGPRFPLARDRFVFQPDITVFRAPPVGFSASAGIGVSIP